MNGPLHQVPWIGGSGRAACALGAAGVMAALASAATAKDLAAQTEPRDATRVPEFATEPEWAPDGRRLVLAAGGWPDLDVYLLEVRSDQLTPLFTGDSTDYMPAQSVGRCHMS